MVDTTILVVIALCQAISGYLGFHMSTAPEKRKARWVFGLLTALVVCLLIVSGVRSNLAQSRMAKEQEGMMTGGDTFCYFMLYGFDQNSAKSYAVIRKGTFPLYGVNMRMVDMDTQQEILNENFNEISGGGDTGSALASPQTWPLPESVYYRIGFNARNGMWHQDLQLRKSTKANVWLAATRVFGKSGEIRFEHIDSEYVGEFGNPMWRP